MLELLVLLLFVPLSRQDNLESAGDLGRNGGGGGGGGGEGGGRGRVC